MGRKAFITAIATSLILFSLIAGIQVIEVAKANPTQTPNLTPTVSILSPKNDSFFNVSIEGVSFRLVYETNTVLSWVGYSIGGNGYSIEGKGSGNVTVSENGTLVRDFGSSGYHTLTLYANDTSGNWATPQTVTYLVNFHVELTPTRPPSPSPTPSPTTTQKGTNGLSDFQLLFIIGLVSAGIIIGVGVALNIKYKKNNPRKQS